MTSQLRKGLQNRANTASSSIKSDTRKFRRQTEDQYGDLQDTHRLGSYGAPSTSVDQATAAAPKGAAYPNQRELDIDHPSFELVRFPKDARDERLRMKAAFASNPKLLGTTTVTDEDYDYLQEKFDFIKYDDFMGWIARNVRRGTQHEAKAFNELFPSFRRRVLSLQKEKLDIVAKLAELRITGPQTVDDWILLYMLANGQVVMPKSIQDIVGIRANTGADLNATDYVRGLFNPTRFISSFTNIAADQQRALANMHIPGLDTAGFWVTDPNGEPSQGFYQPIGGQMSLLQLVTSKPNDAPPEGANWFPGVDGTGPAQQGWQRSYVPFTPNTGPPP